MFLIKLTTFYMTGNTSNTMIKLFYFIEKKKKKTKK